MDEAIGITSTLADPRAGSRLKTARAFIRGGNWNNGSNAGVFTLNLNNAPSNTNTNIGFRCSRYSLLTDNALGQDKASTDARQSQKRILARPFLRESAGAYRVHTSVRHTHAHPGRGQWAPERTYYL